jgi:hypothetical protein
LIISAFLPRFREGPLRVTTGGLDRRKLFPVFPLIADLERNLELVGTHPQAHIPHILTQQPEASIFAVS